MRYASFWQRLLGHVVDIIVIVGVLLAYWCVEAHWRSLAIAFVFPVWLLPHVYEASFHARWGQTLGKMVARARVVTPDGFPITWRDAVLRSAVGIGIALAYAFGRVVALYRIPVSSYAGLTWAERSHALAELSPVPPLLAELSQIWFWSEVVVMLLNRERRALHDFIANTVVVDTRSRKKETKKEVELLGGIRDSIDCQ